MINTLVLIPEKYWNKEIFKKYENNYNFILAEQPTDAELEQAEVIIGAPKVRQIIKCKNLKWIQASFAGVDYYARNKDKIGDIVITNAVGAFGPAISEYVLAMTLSLMKKLPGYRDNQNQGIWNDLGKEDSIVGKQVLVVGAGNIGTHVARLFRLFGCRVDGIRRRIPDDNQTTQNPQEPLQNSQNPQNPQYPFQNLHESFNSMNPITELDTLLQQADIVVLCLPSTKETWHILDEHRLGLMKPSSILINVGRGALIDTDALVKQLQEERIQGAGLDVLEEEPLRPDHPLWECKNAIITPHITGVSFGHMDVTSKLVFDIIEDNLMRYVAGEPLKNLVDFS